MTWSIDKAREHYNIKRWSDGYFDINEQGHVALQLLGQQLDMHELVQDLIGQGVRLPVLVRFADILRSQVKKLCASFEQAISENSYQGHFTCVYPIKVNQQRYVIEEVIQTNARVGLESGSKSELLAVLSVANKKPGATILCNGYKDSEYIRLALIGQQLGHQVYIIIEQASELALIMQEAKQMQVTPRLGVRVRLAAVAQGRWQNSGGEKSKFGLMAGQLQTCIDELAANNMLDALKILHCHIGSQVSNIRDFHKSISEFARYFSHLTQQGVRFEYIDVGGGLGVDYEGTRSRNYFSINYSWYEYANHVVQAFKVICDEIGAPQPNIISESGRAVTAHHAMLVTNVIDVESLDTHVPNLGEDAPSILVRMREAYDRLDEQCALEVYHDAVCFIEEAHQLFHHGLLTIAERGHAESLYAAVLSAVIKFLNPSVRNHRDILDMIHSKLADKMFCNLSVFQSAPDAWAINQVFPILPLSHLDEAPTRRAVLHDITCDSDGKIGQYVDGWGVEETLPVPQFNPEHPYHLGIFMVGAYQEILGDMHNLFGDTDSVHVEVDEDGKFHIAHKVFGDDSSRVLSHVNFNADKLKQSYQEQLERTGLPAPIKATYFDTLAHALEGYTYLED